MGDDLGAAGQAHDLAAPLVDAGPAAGEVAGAGGVAAEAPVDAGELLVDPAGDPALGLGIQRPQNGDLADLIVQPAELVAEPAKKAADSRLGRVERAHNALLGGGEALSKLRPEALEIGLDLVPVSDQHGAGGNRRPNKQNNRMGCHQCGNRSPKQLDDLD